VTVIYLLLSYCLLIAYLAKSTEVLGFFSGALAPSTAAGLLCASTAGLFLFGGTAAADRMNQALTSLLLGLFGFIILTGLGDGDVPAALAAQPAHWEALSPSIPIIFLTLVYHDLIPVICSYLGGDRARVRTALVAGSLIPLLMFLSWEGVALATLPIGGVPLGAGVDPLALFLASASPSTAAAVQVFSFVALITSFTATVVGLTETLRTEVPPLIRSVGMFLGSEKLSTYDSGGSVSGSDLAAIEAALACEDDPKGDACVLEPGQGFAADPGRVLALALTLGPPLAFTAENPGAFLAVLSVAGGYGMTALYGLMPPLMAWRLRQADEARAAVVPPTAAAAPALQPRPRLMPGGVPALAGVLAGATGVGFTRVAVDADGALAALAKAGTQVGAPAVMMDLIADLAEAVAATPAF
jgi:tyrosine-specific transport protein